MRLDSRLHLQYNNASLLSAPPSLLQVRVEDVLTPTSCVCQTEEGRLIDSE